MTELQPLAEPRLNRSGRSIPAGLDEATIATVVADFYGKARVDDLLGPIFRAAIPDEKWPLHLAVIVDFWSSMLLGTGRYRGRPMPVHLALGDLDDQHFLRWLALFRQTVETVCAPEIAALFVDRAERVANSFRLGMAAHRGGDSSLLLPLRAPASPTD